MTTTERASDESVDLACPLCGYNLRGLAEPRCPECGGAFDWGELLDHGRDHHRWLFEHGHGRDARTFVATWLRTAAPGRFWRDVSPANTVHLGRLVRYWLIGCVPLLALVVAPVVHDGIAMNRDLQAFRALYRPVPGRPGAYAAPGRKTVLTAGQLNAVIPPLLSVGFVRRVFIFHRWRDDGPWLGPAAVTAAWPLLSAAALLVFQVSLRRAKVRPAHVLRVAVYGCDFTLLLTAITLAGTRVPIPNPFRTSPITDHTAGAILLAGAACAAVATWRMSVALRRYLQFDRPAWTVMAAQAMAVLSVCAMLVRAARWIP